ncbi:MAG: acyltransferase [Burkholderiaceae bacterium]
MKLSPELSAYLDFLRAAAAFSVLLGHMDQDGMSVDWSVIYRFSHEAVIIFFVLSGFIIYHTTITRESSLSNYVASRVSRIYSVALPAVIMSTIVSIWASTKLGLDASSLSGYREFSVWDFLSSLMFLNQSWTNHAELTLNVPYWSLCYEVWFYIFFGVFVFTEGRTRWGLLFLAACVAGPAIIVLFPIWLMGARLAMLRADALSWGCFMAWTIFLGTVALIVLIDVAGIDGSIQAALNGVMPGFWRLRESQRFVTDYMIGFLVVLHIRSFISLQHGFQDFFGRHRLFLARIAGFSFTLYLFHRPFTQVIGAYWSELNYSYIFSAAITLGILFFCWAISFLTERKSAILREKIKILLR